MTLTLRSVGQRLLVIPCAAALVTIGCGEGQILQSPTGPSGTLGSTTFLTDDSDAGTTAASVGEFDTLARGGNGNGRGNGNGGGGNGNGGGNDKKPTDSDGPGNGKQPENGGGPGRSHEERVVGFVSAKFVDAITVNGINIYAGTDTVIRHGNRILEMADIAVGDHVQARGVMEETKFVAIEIKVQDTGNDNPDVPEDPTVSKVTGAISELSPIATCPVVTFMIGTQKVTTSAATVFDDVTCATLTNTALVQVTGNKMADGSILATKVELQSGPDEVSGTVFELTGTASCATPATAALTFKVGATALTATTVKTTATTTFTGVTCATLANGANVEVEGTKQADGSITAASVELH